MVKKRKRPASGRGGRRKTPFDVEVYERARIADLILFAMLSLKNSGKECTFENLIKKCFLLFPGAMGFFQYPRWPDSRKIDRPLRGLRKEGLITGSPRESFNLTKKGEKVAQEIMKKLKQGKLL